MTDTATTARPTADDPREHEARRRLTPGGIREGVESIVETLHPRPRGADCLPVADLEHALTNFCNDTVRLAYDTGWRTALCAVKYGERVEVMLAAADRAYERHLEVFGDDGPADVESVARRLLTMGVPLTRIFRRDRHDGAESCGLEIDAHPDSECYADVVELDGERGWTWMSMIDPPIQAPPAPLGVPRDADTGTVAARIRALWAGEVEAA